MRGPGCNRVRPAGGRAAVLVPIFSLFLLGLARQGHARETALPPVAGVLTTDTDVPAARADVLAGDEVRVRFGHALPADAGPNAERPLSVTLTRMDAQPGSPPPPDGPYKLPYVIANASEVLATVPSDVTPGAYRLGIGRGTGSPTAGVDARVRVYPRPAATVTEVPEVVRPGERFVVRGSGFFAPEARVVVRVGGASVAADAVGWDGTWIAAVFPEESKDKAKRLSSGVNPFSVNVWGAPAALTRQRDVSRVRTEVRWGLPLIILLALLPVGLVAAAVYLLARRLIHERTYQFAPGGRGKLTGWLQVLLVEPINNTYSLSRFQFLWWLVVLAYGYGFLFFAHGFVAGEWNFPELGGAGYALLISLGTLVFAQVTTSAKGAKGSGEKYPSASDLVVHGGVLALERVQQLVWTIFAGLGFLWIIAKTYATATRTPDIPNEILVLMGISSIGYLGGKAGRKPGPVIHKVTYDRDRDMPDGPTLFIEGLHLSPNARIIINGNPDAGNVAATDTTKQTEEFVPALTVGTSVLQAPAGASPNTLFSITVINPDAQEARWEGPMILSAEGGASAQVVVLRGQGIEKGAHLALLTKTEPLGVATQDAADPNLIGIEPGSATAPVGEPKKPQELVVTNPSTKESVVFRF